MAKVLLVEDDQDLANLADMHLTKGGYQVTWANTCEKGLQYITKEAFDLIILDENLPDGRGTALCEKMHNLCNCPIIFTSCLSDSGTIIKALRSGGDDYMIKPIDYKELLARSDAIIRRMVTGKPVKGSNHVFRQFTLDTTSHKLTREGEEVELSTIEYDLLLYMIENPKELLLYRDIYLNVWGRDSLDDIRTLMVHISHLRKKIDPNHVGVITTVRNAGYIFADV